MAFVSSLSTSASLSRRGDFHGNALATTAAVRSPTDGLAPLQTRRTSMLLRIPFFTKEEEVALPQYDRENASERQKQIAEERERFKWTKEKIVDASMVAGLPKDQFASLGWIEEAFKGVVSGELNKIAIRIGSSAKDMPSVRSIVMNRISKVIGKILLKLSSGQADEKDLDEVLNDLESGMEASIQGQGQTLQEYKDLFRVLKPGVILKDNQFLRDDIFGWYRVAGPNPFSIAKLSEPVSTIFPEFSNDILQGIPAFENDSLEDLAREGRLFYMDFKEYETYPPGKFEDGTSKENKFYLYAPTALLAIPKNPDERTTVLPLAIRCGQDAAKYPMYTPNKKHTDEVTWIAAKMTVQVADGYRHQAVCHLGRGHLLAEVFNCAMHRAFSPSHPIRKLMTVHFEGTAFTNVLADKKLLTHGGFFGNSMAPHLDFTRKYASESINSPTFRFDEWSTPELEFESRGVMDPQLKFPFRDDSLKLWHVFLEWVRTYLSVYYKSDADVVNDNELAQWYVEVSSPDCGNLHGFGEGEDGKIKTFDYMVQSVTKALYSVSVRHAAVHFPITTLQDFMPAQPITGCAPAPTTAKPYRDIDHWVEEMLPDVSIAMNHLSLETFGGVKAGTMFGDYGKEMRNAPDEVEKALKEFQMKLAVISNEIEARNAKEREVGLPVYDYLLPKNIPNAVNV